MIREDILNKAHSLSEKAEVVGKTMPKSSIIAASIDMAEWVLNNLWKPADGEDLPEVGREVVVFTQNFPDDAGIMKVGIAYRPDPKEHYIPKTYGNSGWNIPDVKFWLDVELPKEIEL